MDKTDSEIELIVDSVLAYPKPLERLGTINHLRSDLIEKKRRFLKDSKDHQRMERSYRVVYLTLGCIHVVASVVVGCMTGSVSLQDQDDGFMMTVFLLAMVSAILSALLNFIGIEEKIAKHHSSSGQYMDLYKDLSTFILISKDKEDYLHEEKIILEKDKFVSGYAPSLSSCCL